MAFSRVFVDERKLSAYMWSSAVIHCLVFTFVLVWPWISPNEIERRAHISVIQAAVRVDIVEMPKETLQELMAVQEASKGAEVAKEVIPEKTEDQDTTSLKYIKERQDFMDMLKSLGKKKAKEGKDGLSKDFKGELKNLVLAGNKLSKGTAIIGGGTAAEMEAFSEYISTLPDWVRPHWKLPTYLRGQTLRCRIQISLTAKGDLLRASIYESSGNVDYDQRSMIAIKEAIPYPEVPEEIKYRVARGDIILGFPL